MSIIHSLFPVFNAGAGPVPVKQPHKFPLVHANDQWIVQLVNPSAQGPWIAGGACLKWYQHQQLGLGDVDVFCENKMQATALIDKLSLLPNQSVRFTSVNATTFELWRVGDFSVTWQVQVITMDYFRSMQDIIDRFDISVCKIATDGTRFVLGESTAADIRARTLRMVLPLRSDSIKRMIKYQVYGYRPSEDLIAAISNSPDLNWSFIGDNEYDKSF